MDAVVYLLVAHQPLSLAAQWTVHHAACFSAGEVAVRQESVPLVQLYEAKARTTSSCVYPSDAWLSISQSFRGTRAEHICTLKEMRLDMVVDRVSKHWKDGCHNEALLKCLELPEKLHYTPYCSPREE